MAGTGFSAQILVLDTGVFHPNTPSRSHVASSEYASTGLGRLFAERARLHSDSVAMATASRDWTYDDLLEAAVQTAAAIRNCRGFLPGGRVILLLSNSFEYVAAFYGTLIAGGVVVPLPPQIEEQAFERISLSTEAFLIVTSVSTRRLPTALTNIPRQVLSFENTHSVVDQSPLPVMSFDEVDLAAIFFTSGSSGDPKGVMLSHQNLIQNAGSIQQYLEIDSFDRPLCVLPFFHAFGNSVLQSHVLAGATLILDGTTLFPETLIGSLVRHRATSLAGVPDLFRLLLERTSLGQSPESTAFPALRYMAVAGGSLRHDMAIELARRIAPARFFVMYGQTEATARLAFVPPDLLAELPAGCIGRAIPSVVLEVVNEQGDPVTAGEMGELRARGGNVMLGYWNDPSGTRDRIRDGWLYTGDLATIDDQGWIFHQGRRSAIVKVAGFRVHPSDLEEFALRRLFVAQAVAVPFEQPHVGTRLALFVRQSSSEPMTSEEMLARCRTELPRHLAPSFVRHLDEFPLNSSLKIDRICLSQIAEQIVVENRPNPNLDSSIVKKRGSS